MTTSAEFWFLNIAVPLWDFPPPTPTRVKTPSSSFGCLLVQHSCHTYWEFGIVVITSSVLLHVSSLLKRPKYLVVFYYRT